MSLAWGILVYFQGCHGEVHEIEAGSANIIVVSIYNNNNRIYGTEKTVRRSCRVCTLLILGLESPCLPKNGKEPIKKENGGLG